MDVRGLEPGADLRVYRQTEDGTLKTEPRMLLIDEETVLVRIMREVICWEYLLETARA